MDDSGSLADTILIQKVVGKDIRFFIRSNSRLIQRCSPTWFHLEEASMGCSSGTPELRRNQQEAELVVRVNSKLD